MTDYDYDYYVINVTIIVAIAAVIVVFIYYFICYNLLNYFKKWKTPDQSITIMCFRMDLVPDKGALFI